MDWLLFRFDLPLSNRPAVLGNCSTVSSIQLFLLSTLISLNGDRSLEQLEWQALSFWKKQWAKGQYPKGGSGENCHETFLLNMCLWCCKFLMGLCGISSMVPTVLLCMGLVTWHGSSQSLVYNQQWCMTPKLTKLTQMQGTHTHK